VLCNEIKYNGIRSSPYCIIEAGTISKH